MPTPPRGGVLHAAEDADEPAERPDHEPVAAELLPGRGVGHVDPRLGGEAGRPDPEVDDRLRVTVAIERDELLGGSKRRAVASPAEPPEPPREPEDDALAGHVVEDQRARKRADERASRIAGPATEATDEPERTRDRDLRERDPADRLVDSLGGRIDRDPMPLRELVLRQELVERSHSTIFQNAFLTTTSSPRNVHRSQPRTSRRCPSTVVPRSVHSETPRSPETKSPWLS